MKDKSKKLFSGHKVDIVFDWRNKSNEEKKGAVSIRLYERGGKRKYINTGVSIFPREWSDELKMVYGRSDAPQLNAQIREVQNLCMQKIKEALEIDGQSESALENAVIKIDTGQTSFLDFIRAGIDNARKTGKLAEPTLIKHEGMLRELEAWGEMKKFADVSPVKINEFIDTIRCKTVGKLDEDGKVHPVRISEPAVYNYYKNLRKWINEAIGL